MKQGPPFKNYFYPLPSCYNTGNYDIHNFFAAYGSYDPTANVKKKWPYYIYIAVKKIYRHEHTVTYKKKEKVLKLIPCIEGLFFSNPYYCIQDCLIYLYTKKYDLPETFLDRDIMIRDIRTDYKSYNVGSTYSAVNLIVDWNKLLLS